jgi:L-rhamnonate dehydratase
MKIKQLRAVSVKIPTPSPKSKARRPSWNERAPRAFPINKYPEFSGFHTTTPGSKLNTPVWVQVTADDGTWGLGRCGFGEPVAALIDSHFAPLIEGRDPMALEYLNDLMWRSTQLFGASGISAVAQSGIDLALWDLKGKILNQPVYKLLGGPSREKVALYCTSDDLDWSKELGFRAFKISNPVNYEMGVEGLDLLEEKIAKAREEVGPSAELMFNPVMSFNVEFTLRLAERLRPYGLRWLEEPLIPSDLEGHIELKRAITWIPLATGEHHHRRQTFRQLVENRAVDIVQPDIAWCGGLSEAIKIYTIAEAAGISTIPHTGAGTPWGQHFGIAMPESPMAEFWMGSDPGVPLDEVCPIPGMPMPVNGDVIPSDAPGFGMEIAADWIEPYRANS